MVGREGGAAPGRKCGHFRTPPGYFRTEEGSYRHCPRPGDGCETADAPGGCAPWSEARATGRSVRKARAVGVRPRWRRDRRVDPAGRFQCGRCQTGTAGRNRTAPGSGQECPAIGTIRAVGSRAARIGAARSGVWASSPRPAKSSASKAFLALKPATPRALARAAAQAAKRNRCSAAVYSSNGVTDPSTGAAGLPVRP